MSHIHDMAVVGGGPAGLAAGIRATQLGLDAVVIEKKSAPIDKACGEGLMPAALAGLDALGVERPDGHPFVGIRYIDAHRPCCSATGDFNSPGLGVRRVELHRRMWQRADALGVERLQARVDAVVHRRDHIEVAGVRARYLVGADGLHSTVRRQLDVAPDARAPRRYGVRRHFRCAPWTDRVEVYWSPRAEAYVTPVGPELVGVAFLAEGGGRFEQLLPHFPSLATRLDRAQPTTDVLGGGPFEARLRRRVHGHILLVGDAAGYLDPLTGEGVALAIATASAAVEAIAAEDPARYDARYRQLTREYYWLTGLLLAISRRRWLHRPVIGALDRLPWVFDGALRMLGGV